MRNEISFIQLGLLHNSEREMRNERREKKVGEWQVISRRKSLPLVRSFFFIAFYFRISNIKRENFFCFWPSSNCSVRMVQLELIGQFLLMFYVIQLEVMGRVIEPNLRSDDFRTCVVCL